MIVSWVSTNNFAQRSAKRRERHELVVEHSNTELLMNICTRSRMMEKTNISYEIYKETFRT